MSNEHLIIILGTAGITIFTKFFSVVALGKIGVPKYLVRWLKYIPVAVFTSLAIPPLLVSKGSLSLSIHNDYLISGIISIFVAWRFCNFPLTILTGTAVMLFLRWVNN